jgi:nucleoside-diphosphate-sugar epimerase
MTAVVLVGLGYVGLPLAMRAAQAGHRVIGYDTDPNIALMNELAMLAHDPVLPVLAGGADARAEFPVCRTAKDVNSHMPDYVARRLMMAFNKHGRTINRIAHPAAGARLQEEHRRRTGVTGLTGRAAAEEHGSGRAGRRPACHRDRRGGHRRGTRPADT